MSVSDETGTVTDGIIVTDAAAAKVKALLDQEGRDDLALRVAVQPGGCSGLRYQLFFDERSLDGDVEKDFDGVKVVTDRMSAPYLGGATIDFVVPPAYRGFSSAMPPSGIALPSDPTTFRSPSGSSSVTVRSTTLAIMMQTLPSHGVSVTVTFTSPDFSLTEAA